jgi:hypothetical protein
MASRTGNSEDSRNCISKHPRRDIADASRRVLLVTTAAALLTTAALAVVQSVGLTASVKRNRRRRGSRVQRVRRELLDAVVPSLSDQEFQICFRMARDASGALVALLRSSLERDELQGARGGGSRVFPEVRLAITLCLLAGGAHWDLMSLFQVGRSSVYNVLHRTVDAIVTTMKLPGVPMDKQDALRQLANEFKWSRRQINPLDGIAIAIEKPANA